MRVLKFVLIFLSFSGILLVSSLLLARNLLPVVNENQTILILGKGGENHTGPDLTDTMMVSFINKDSKNIKILSLPRDIWIPQIRAKLNSAYHYGGYKMVDESVNSVTNFPVTNTLVIDFSLFKDVIDAMGGINVNVVNSFTDQKYPIAGKENDLCGGDKLYKCRYETIQFTQGKQQMNGELALKFVRSRNAVGDEGTDLAREKRQQQVISAVKDKLLSKDILLNPKTIKNLYNIAITHVETDINFDKSIAIMRLLFESRNNISFISIPEQFLTVSQNNIKYDKQYVFIPKSGSWKELQEWLSKIVDN